jgi:hypothetical protein
MFTKSTENDKILLMQSFIKEVLTMDNLETDKEIKTPKKHKEIIPIAVILLVIALIAVVYGTHFKDINKILHKVTATATAKPVDEFPIPAGLGKEDKQLRQRVKTFYIKTENFFALNETEVKKYLKTGKTENFKSFEVLNDAQDKPAFVVVKGGENGFSKENLQKVENAVERLNQIDSDIVRKEIINKDKVFFVAADMGGQKVFIANPSFLATYSNTGYGNYIIINQKTLSYEAFPESYKKKGMNAEILGTLVIEGRAIYTTSFGDTVTTTAPDRLDKRIGVDKGLFMLNKAREWHKNNKIDENEKIVLDKSGNDQVESYSKS